jgi:hypothetical protein
MTYILATIHIPIEVSDSYTILHEHVTITFNKLSTLDEFIKRPVEDNCLAEFDLHDDNIDFKKNRLFDGNESGDGDGHGDGHGDGDGDGHGDGSGNNITKEIEIKNDDKTDLKKLHANTEKLKKIYYTNKDAAERYVKQSKSNRWKQSNKDPQEELDKRMNNAITESNIAFQLYKDAKEKEKAAQKPNKLTEKVGNVIANVNNILDKGPWHKNKVHPITEKGSSGGRNRNTYSVNRNPRGNIHCRSSSLNRLPQKNKQNKKSSGGSQPYDNEDEKLSRHLEEQFNEWKKDRDNQIKEKLEKEKQKEKEREEKEEEKEKKEENEKEEEKEKREKSVRKEKSIIGRGGGGKKSVKYKSKRYTSQTHKKRIY